MKCKFMLSSLVVVLVAGLVAPWGMAESRKVVFVTGDDEYHSREIMVPFAKKLEEDYGFEVAYLADEAFGADTDPDHDPKATPLVGVEEIKDADLVVLFIRFRHWDDASMKIFMDYFDSGKPGIAIRTTTHAFWKDRTFSPKYFGGHYKTHYTRGVVAQVDPDNADHPMARGIPYKYSVPEGPYVSVPLSNGVTPVVLAYGHNRKGGLLGDDSYDSPNYPVAWAYNHDGARRSMITLGSDRVEDEKSAMMQGLFYNSVFWALGDEVPEGGVLAAGDDFVAKKESAPYVTPKHDYPAPPALQLEKGWQILFDGSDLRHWKHWDYSIPPLAIPLDGRAASQGPIDYTKSPARWEIEDGAVVARVGYGDIVTKEHFSEYELRLDFLVPDAPAWVTGEWRGNSGVYLNGAFEIAISDSHGLEASDRTTGAIYRQAAPSKEASKPAGEWQTLEVTFKGGKAKVVLNGETIHKKAKLKKPTPYGYEDTASGPIRLQAESASVRFANIAIKRLAPKISKSASDARPGEVFLFNGTTLAGWKADDPVLFRVEDGAIVVGKLGHELEVNQYLYSRAKFDDFELRAEVRVSSDHHANSGIQFWTSYPEEGTEAVGFQADAGAHMGAFIWGGLWDNGRRNVDLVVPDTEETQPVYRSGDWNDLVVRGEGQRIQVWFNGVQTVDYTEEDDSVATSGRMGFQAHVGPSSEVSYRNIFVKKL